jgi:hypothetical protein
MYVCMYGPVAVIVATVVDAQKCVINERNENTTKFSEISCENHMQIVLAGQGAP